MNRGQNGQYDGLCIPKIYFQIYIDNSSPCKIRKHNGVSETNILFSERPVIGILLLLPLGNCIEYKLINPDTKDLKYIIKGNYYDSSRMQMKNLIRLHVEGYIDSLNLDISRSRVEYRIIIPSVYTIKPGDLHPENDTRDKKTYILIIYSH